jgi:hypothetical protein
MFIDKTFTVQYKLARRKLIKDILVYNVDGTKSFGGSITKEVDCKGTSIHFLTYSPLPSPSAPLSICTSPTPLYHP